MTASGGSAEQRVLNVLVVDDHVPLRKLIVKGLAANLPAHVGQAADIAGALEELSQGNYDALVSDVNLPGGSSIEALPRLRAAAPGARIVLMSAAAPPGLADAALAAGADVFVPKSAGVIALCRAVRPGWEPTEASRSAPPNT